MKMADSTVNAMMAGIETDVGVSPKLQVWSGTVPADETAAPAGTKLVEMTLPSDWLTAPSAGIVAKNGNWTGTAIAAGTATFARICTSAGVSKIQATISIAGGGGEAIIDNSNINTTQVVTVTSFSFTGPHL